VRTSAVYVAALSSVVLIAGVFTIVIDLAEPSAIVRGGSISVDFVNSGTELQPLADDLAWVYRPRDGATPAGLALTTAIVGHDRIGDQPVWLLEQWVGESFALRLATILRGEDLWVVAVDEVKDGDWSREILEEPQLFQPGIAGARSWTFDLAGHDYWADNTMSEGRRRKGPTGRFRTWVVETFGARPTTRESTS
jgi:hypothetical protein